MATLITALNEPPRFQIGQELDVLFEPSNPQKVRINRWMNLYFVPTLLCGLGAACWRSS